MLKQLLISPLLSRYWRECCKLLNSHLHIHYENLDSKQRTLCFLSLRYKTKQKPNINNGNNETDWEIAVAFPRSGSLSTAFSDRIEFRSVEFCGGRKTENPEKDTYIAIKDENGI